MAFAVITPKKIKAATNQLKLLSASLDVEAMAQAVAAAEVAGYFEGRHAIVAILKQVHSWDFPHVSS